MTGAGICEGDTVVIEQMAEVPSGTICSVYLKEEGREVIRTVRNGRPSNAIILTPENVTYERKWCDEGTFVIQGRVAALMRRYT